MRYLPHEFGQVPADPAAASRLVDVLEHQPPRWRRRWDDRWPRSGFAVLLIVALVAFWAAVAWWALPASATPIMPGNHPSGPWFPSYYSTVSAPAWMRHEEPRDLPACDKCADPVTPVWSAPPPERPADPLGGPPPVDLTRLLDPPELGDLPQAARFFWVWEPHKWRCLVHPWLPMCHSHDDPEPPLPETPPEIPLPAALPLLGGALGALALFASRRR